MDRFFRLEVIPHPPATATETTLTIAVETIVIATLPTPNMADAGGGGRYTGVLVAACVLGVVAFALATLLAIALLVIRRGTNRKGVGQPRFEKPSSSDGESTIIGVRSVKPDPQEWTICDPEIAKPTVSTAAGPRASTMVNVHAPVRQPPSFVHYGPLPSMDGNRESVDGVDRTTAYNDTHASDHTAPPTEVIPEDDPAPRYTPNTVATMPSAAEEVLPSSPPLPTPEDAAVPIVISENDVVALVEEDSQVLPSIHGNPQALIPPPI
ncbi:hypothetical protein NMY22_g14552 [Coprinellus aureogranulatus]|nr:hypothetical protein NMY22_g14552 [Coprinellus aureogranulatus]